MSFVGVAFLIFIFLGLPIFVSLALTAEEKESVGLRVAEVGQALERRARQRHAASTSRADVSRASSSM